MATITVQTPRHTKGSLQCGRDPKPTREHTVLHRSRSTNRTRKTNDEVLFDESRSPKYHLKISLVCGLATKNRLGERVDGLRPIASGIENFEL